MMDKKDAIDYLLYMKHDVQAGSPVDVAIDTAIESLKATVKQPKTNGDKIRAMKDEELAELYEEYADCRMCVYSPHNCKSECVDGYTKWLKQEVIEDAGND